MNDLSRLSNTPIEFLFLNEDGTSKNLSVKALTIAQIETLRAKVLGEAKLRWSNRLKDATQSLSPDIRNSIIIEACKSNPDLSKDTEEIILEDRFVTLALELAGVNRKDIEAIFKVSDNIKNIIDAWRHALGLKEVKEEEVKGETEIPLA